VIQRIETPGLNAAQKQKLQPWGVEGALHASPVPSLFLFHVGSNAGYAIERLESLFLAVGTEIAAGDAGLVHFGYRGLERGRPKTLPGDFRNLLRFELQDASREKVKQLADYVRKHRIRLVVAFDVQPAGPLFGPLHDAGVHAIIAYWGAAISSRMPTWKLLLKRLELAASTSKVDGLIFESHAMAELAIHGRGVSAEMIDVVPLGADTELFKPRVSDYVYQAFGFPRDRRVIVYAGHMEPRKGVRTLVEAAMELLVRRRRSDVCFLLCGNTGDQSAGYEKMYAGQGLTDFIRFGGYRSDLPEIYPSCFCGVIPSTGWDSFTCGAVEMAASGLPVIASRLQGLAEAVLDGATGLLYEPGNALALADCLEELLDRPERATELGRCGRERCEKELSLELHRQRFREVLLKRLRLSTRRQVGPYRSV
jgi:glycosyltransferase involved in cell wall biosynthesis